MLINRQERVLPIEIDTGRKVQVVAFAANGEYIVSGDEEVRVWRVEDGKQVASMKTGEVYDLVVSNDGRKIAAGTCDGEVFVWDATTFEQVFNTRENIWDVHGLDFSPDSTRFVSASTSGTASVWDIVTRKRTQILRCTAGVNAAKYSPQGDRIAIATHRLRDSVQVWDSSNGDLLVAIDVEVNKHGLVWLNDHLFVLSKDKIKQLDASTGSTLSEWPIPDSDISSFIALPNHGKFMACSTKRTVTFWDTSTHSQLGLIGRSQNVYSIAFSQDDRFLAVGGQDGKISIESLSRITVSNASSHYTHLIVLPHRLQCHCLVYTPLFRNLPSRSTTLRLTHGGTTSSRTQTPY